MQCACTILSSVACLTYRTIFFHIISQTVQFKKKIEHNISVLDFSTNLSGEFFILRIIQRDTTINVHIKYALLLSDFNEN